MIRRSPPALHKIPRRPPERPAKGMTIAAGFVCNEGVLLASDTLYTGINKRHGQKMWSFSTGVLTSRSRPQADKATSNRLRRELEITLKDGISLEEAIEIVDRGVVGSRSRDVAAA